jgi:hypothetical protein
MPSAVRNYLGYRKQKQAWMLGRFIVDAARLEELNGAAGGKLGTIPLSVIVGADVDADRLASAERRGFAIESIEIKGGDIAYLRRVCEKLPANVECYFETPVHPVSMAALEAITATRSRAKLRMGGVVAEAIPSPAHIVAALNACIKRGVAFKATAGLHHPLRGEHALTQAHGSPFATMHGFVNLYCAVALLLGGGNEVEARAVLEEEDAEEFHVARESIGWRNLKWSTAELREVRMIFASFGSCSFTEPVRDLEALGWL